MGILFVQTANLSPFDLIEEFDVHVTNLPEFNVSALTNHVDVICALLHTPHNGQQALQALLVV